MEDAADMEYVMFLMKHIDNPCTEPVTGRNIRHFYLREAKRSLHTINNPYAREILEEKIKEYDI